MRRRLFNIFTGFSLVLCIVTAMMWVQSYVNTQGLLHFGDTADGRVVTAGVLKSGDGKFSFLWIGDRDPYSGHWHLATFSQHPSARGAPHGNPFFPATIVDGFAWLGAMFQRQLAPQGHMRSLTYIEVPCWQPVTLAAIAPGIWLIRRIRRRIPPGHCQHCGYDIRATPEGGGELLARCPECGKESAATANAR